MGAMAFIPRSTDPIHKQLCETVLSDKNRIVIEPETIFPASGLVFLPCLPGWGWGIALAVRTVSGFDIGFDNSTKVQYFDSNKVYFLMHTCCLAVKVSGN